MNKNIEILKHLLSKHYANKDARITMDPNIDNNNYIAINQTDGTIDHIVFSGTDNKTVSIQSDPYYNSQNIGFYKNKPFSGTNITYTLDDLGNIINPDSDWVYSNVVTPDTHFSVKKVPDENNKNNILCNFTDKDNTESFYFSQGSVCTDISLHNALLEANNIIMNTGKEPSINANHFKAIVDTFKRYGLLQKSKSNEANINKANIKEANISEFKTMHLKNSDDITH